MGELGSWDTALEKWNDPLTKGCVRGIMGGVDLGNHGVLAGKRGDDAPQLVGIPSGSVWIRNWLLRGADTETMSSDSELFRTTTLSSGFSSGGRVATNMGTMSLAGAT
jgi:hypothetical protein